MPQPRAKRKPLPPAPRKSPPSDSAPEEDGGFEQSHGYGPGHGGPTGPGDVPGDEAPGGPAKQVPTPEDDEISRA
jgi:hypothetical protein